jgi:DNA-binding NarL/FixJ family response regulator
MKVAVGIVDDKSQNLHLFAERLNYSDDIAIVLTAGGGNDFLDQMKKLPLSSHPLVILMDIGMPEMDGIETVQVAKLLYPHIHFLMLTVFDDDDKLFEAIKAGADGYLLKNDKLASIIDCIVQLSETGSAPMSPRIARKTLDLLLRSSLTEVENEAPEKKAAYALSDRETEILKLTVDGYPYKAIAEKLFLSSHTVRKHISNIYTKLHVSSKAQAIKIATKNRLI